MEAVFPKQLESASWRKNKSIIKTMTEATGVDKQLQMAETVFRAIKWKALQQTKANLTPEEFAAAEKEIGGLNKLIKVVETAEVLASKAAALWSKERTTAKETVKAAKDVADAAADYLKILNRYASDHAARSKELKGEMQKAKAHCKEVSDAYVTAATHLKAADPKVWSVTAAKNEVRLRKAIEQLPADHPSTRSLKANMKSFCDEMNKVHPQKLDGKALDKAIAKLAELAKKAGDEARKAGEEMAKV